MPTIDELIAAKQTETTKLIVKSVPVPLKRFLAGYAEARGHNMNDVVIALIERLQMEEQNETA